ncbi:MAG: DUF5644 domain-containing protein [Campylobacteraceae bacterium]|jgi:succinate dehydrogenase/fumarate reductase-like Fe-S protein|nr:DUF5644 domain-containing protein [Campylobacteraceae bacterium]
MSYTLNISVFRFNAKSDFLPYYKQYKVTAEQDAELLDVLNLIKKQDKDFSFSKNKFLGVKVNSITTFTQTPISTIVKAFSKSFTLEPISEFYAINDLDVDTSDFEKKLKPLKAFIEEGDEEYYRELISYYYSSPTLEFEREYFGDSLMLFAIFLIKKYPQKRDDVLRAIADERYGVWLHTSIKNSIFTHHNAVNIEKNIAELKREILQYIPSANSITKREAKRVKNLFS